MKRNEEGIGEWKGAGQTQYAEIQEVGEVPKSRLQISNIRLAKGRTEANKCQDSILRWSPVSDPRTVSSQDFLVIPCQKTIASALTNTILHQE